jgi:hypothetical protein
MRFETGRIVLLGTFMLVPTLALAADPPSKKVQPIKKSNASTVVEKKTDWKSMFDGKSLKGWEVVKDIDYEESGKIEVKNKWLVLEAGNPGTGVRWTQAFPKTNYEVKFKASRLDGRDFFCGFTFPVGEGSLTLILGGWGGTVVGLSNIDGYSAVENETTQGFDFKNGQWYQVHLRVNKQKVEIWLDDEQIIDFEHKGRKLSVRWEVEACLPVGFATWQTTGGLQQIRYRQIPADQIDESTKK